MHYVQWFTHKIEVFSPNKGTSNPWLLQLLRDVVKTPGCCNPSAPPALACAFPWHGGKMTAIFPGLMVTFQSGRNKCQDGREWTSVSGKQHFSRNLQRTSTLVSWSALVKWPSQQQGTPGKFFKLGSIVSPNKIISNEEERKCKLVKQLAMSATNILTTKVTIMESSFSLRFDSD